MSINKIIEARQNLTDPGAYMYQVLRISTNITNLVCYTYFHLFFSPECQHNSENRRGIHFSPQKRLKHGRQNIRLH